MLTPSERNLLVPMMLRSRAGDYLDLVKMRSLVPIDAEDELTGYKAKIIEMVFDPLHIAETNERFQAAGFIIPDEMNVIAVNNDGTILVWWGRLNCIFWLELTGARGLGRNPRFRRADTLIPFIASHSV